MTAWLIPQGCTGWSQGEVLHALYVGLSLQVQADS